MLIIGSGPLGMALAVCLRRHGVPRTGISLLDRHPEPLACWRRRAAAVGMPQLRSPAIFHIDLAPPSLLSYASATGKALGSIDQPPSLQLFEDHSRHVIEEAGLGDACIRGTARSLTPISNGWRIETEHGSLEARAVVLALGGGEDGRWPTWARSLARRGVSIGHVLETEDRFWRSGAVTVVGSGLSAVQVALAAAGEGLAVTVLMERPPKIAEYDFDQRWFQDDAPSLFRSAWPHKHRLALLVRARYPGSVPAATAEYLAGYLGEGPGRIRVLSEPIRRVAARGSKVRLFLATNTIDADHLVLATGFDGQLPGRDWLVRTARALGLSLAPSGHPVLDGWLQWAPGLHATGALAELEVGPAARGLAGGRQAARLIAQRLCSR